MAINDHNVEFEIDTGVKCNLLSLQTVRLLDVEHKFVHSTVFIQGVHGAPECVYGTIQINCIYKVSLIC